MVIKAFPVNPILFRMQFRLCECQGVRAHHDLRGRLLYGIHSLFFYPYLVLSWLNRHLDIALQEIRSCFERISLRYREQIILVTDPQWERNATQHLVLCTRTQARSACISEMAAKHPWATVVDLTILLEGWDKGERWASHENTMEFCNAQTASNTQTFKEYTPVKVAQNSN
jgi:hypothetical protein